MELNEVDVLREQVRLLTQRVAELESQNTKHMAMLQVIAVKAADEKGKADE